MRFKNVLFLVGFISFGLECVLEAQTTAPISAPVDVPLQFISNPQYDLVIYVSYGSNSYAYPYLFDTGSFDFATATGTNSFWSGASLATTSGSFTESFTGAPGYKGELGTATVSLMGIASTTGSNAYVSSPILTIPNSGSVGPTFGIITEPSSSYPNWNSNVNSSPPVPPEGLPTFGTFGAGISTITGTATLGGPISVPSILGQIPYSPTSGMDQGFIVHSGAVNVGGTVAVTGPGLLTIGLTQDQIAKMPQMVQMNASTSTLLTSTNQAVNVYPENQFTGTITLVDTAGHTYADQVLVIADSGGGGMHVLYSYASGAANTFSPPAEFLANGGTSIADGVNFSLTISGTNDKAGLDWSFTAGETDYVNKVGIDAAPSGSFNTGIALYNNYDVMYDTTTGLAGFNPVNLNLTGNNLFQGFGTYTSALGTDMDQIQWTGSGGFSAQNGNLIVNIGGDSTPETLTWGGSGQTQYFVADGQALEFGSATSTGTVIFENSLSLSGNQTILVAQRVAALGTGPSVNITGNLSGNGSLSLGNSSNTGVLELSGNNTAYTGDLIFGGGKVILGSADAISGSSQIYLDGGTFDLNGFSETFSKALVSEGLGNIDSSIDFGFGHLGGVTLTFARSNTELWTHSFDLLDFTVGIDALSFTDSTGLTADQLDKIDLAGFLASGLDSNGDVLFTEIPEPSQYGFFVLLVTASFFGLRRFSNRKMRSA